MRYHMDTIQDFSLIKQVLDKHFTFSNSIGRNVVLSDEVPLSMVDPARKGAEGWTYWSSIAGTVTDAELAELEGMFGFGLPLSYRYFLRQRHFLELQLGKQAIVFFRNLPFQLVKKIRETIERSCPQLVGSAFLPFAFYMDSGILCFDARVTFPDHDYPVVLLSVADGFEEKKWYANSFLDLFQEFNLHVDQWIKSNTRSLVGM